MTISDQTASPAQNSLPGVPAKMMQRIERARQDKRRRVRGEAVSTSRIRSAEESWDTGRARAIDSKSTRTWGS